MSIFNNDLQMIIYQAQSYTNRNRSRRRAGLACRQRADLNVKRELSSNLSHKTVQPVEKLLNG
jgi:hypothetical protein